MGDQSFGAAAARLAGLAGRLLGWRPDEFWRATPAELAVIVQSYGAAQGEPPVKSEISALMKRFPDQ